MKRIIAYRLFFLFTWMLLSTITVLQAQREKDSGMLNRTIQLQSKKNTLYRLLNEVSQKSGYLFIYDSKIMDNEKKVKVKKGTYTIREAIYQIIGNKKLELRVIGNHILISQPTSQSIPDSSVTTHDADPRDIITLTGMLVDKDTNEPIPFGTVSVSNSSIGNITNQNGEFKLHLPDSMRTTSSIRFSHIGYQPQSIETKLLAGQMARIALEPKIIPIQEVVIRVVNPLRLLRQLQEKRSLNYAQKPVYLTTFYREGIERKNRFVNLTEAIFKIYKAPYKDNPVADQVKLLKMRRISNPAEKDTLITKMKSGIQACLLLDIMKETQEFLIANDQTPYIYAPTDITVIDDKLVNVVYFEQKKQIDYPLYKGELYIDPDSSVLLRARFEINPAHIKKAAGILVEKKSRHLNILPQKAVYTLSYKKWKGVYYMNHVRGDLYFKVKKKKQVFGGYALHAWFEMATCKIENQQVTRFTRQETLSTRTIFSDTPFSYDASFWGNFNVIPPEEQLNEAIRKIASKIEETGY